MAYTNFTSEKIFKDPTVNILCNSIFDEITNNFPAVVSTEFAVTGTLAKIIQGDEPASTKILVLPFITINNSIYDYCASDLPKSLGATAIKFTDRIQLKYQNIFFEVWKTNTLNVIDSNKIIVQITADIPANIN